MADQSSGDSEQPPLRELHEGRMVYIQAEDKTFAVHWDILARQSEVFATLFRLPQAVQSDSMEGLIESYPIVLPGIQADEFAHLLKFCYNDDWEPPYSCDRLIAVLRLATMYEMEQPRKWAIFHLATVSDTTLPPARRFWLGKAFHVEEWIEPSFRAMVAAPLSKLTFNDISGIGLWEYMILSKTKESIENEKRLVAQAPPPPLEPPTTWECISHQTCLRVWRDAWWEAIGRKLLHPNPLLMMDLTDGFEAAKKLNLVGMTSSCREAMLAAVTEVGFQGEERIISQVIPKLLAGLPQPKRLDPKDSDSDAP